MIRDKENNVSCDVIGYTDVYVTVYVYMRCMSFAMLLIEAKHLDDDSAISV